MKCVFRKSLRTTFVGFIVLFSASLAATAAVADSGISARDAEIGGVKLHYLTAGHGSSLILLHGYAETSLMWRPIIPVLAQRFTVIAPDLPGIGDSAIPNDGLDMKNAAVRIHDLAKSLGVQKAEVAGHDIGLMVAYAYAAQFPAEDGKLLVHALAQQMKLVASNVTVVVLKDTGHWVLEERPKETTEALQKFL